MVIIINFTIIPSLITIMAEYEDHKRKSGKQQSVIRRIHFFMLLNTLLLPVTETSSAFVLFVNLTHTDI